jgi:hypothetical protein
MSDSTGAANIVRNKFETAQNYANDAWSSALHFLNNLGGVAKLVYPDVGLPDLPELPTYPTSLRVPDLETVSLPDVAAPEPPSLVGLTLDGIEMPRFSVLPPDIVLPDTPAPDLPEAPGQAPNMPDLELPADPVVILPDPPVFDAVAIPDLPGPITPAFEGERPPLPSLVTPGNLFVVPVEAEYVSPLRAVMADRLKEALARGGTGHGPELETDLWNRARRRAEETLATRLAELGDTFAARGCSALSGPMAALLRQAYRDHATALAETNLDIVTKQTDLAVASDRAAFDQALALEGQGIELFNATATRAFEAAKALAQFGYEALHAEVAVHNAQLAHYQADAAVFEARIRAGLSELEAYKTRLEGTRLAGEAQKRAADLYVAQLSGVSSLISIYKARMEGAAAKSAINRDRLAAYEAQVQAYVAGVNANTARLNAHAAAIAGQEAKARVYAEQVKAFAQQVAAAKTAAETQLAVSSEENRVALETYRADVTRFEAELRQAQAKTETLLKDKELALRQYELALRARDSDAAMLSKDHAAQVDAYLKAAEVSIKEADMLLQNSLGELRLEAEKIRSGAQVSAQMAASALSSVNASAQIGYSESVGQRTNTSTSESTQRSVSETTANSNGFRESYNHNYNYRVS